METCAGLISQISTQSDEKGPALLTHLQQIIDRVHKSLSLQEVQELF